MFKENREGATPAIQYWYFPGEKIGKEFVYPKDQAQRIAARTGQKVRTESGYVSSDTAVTSTDSKGETTEWKHEGQATASADNSNAVQGASGLSAENDSTLKNAPASSQPTASAGSLTGNRGIEPSGQVARQDTDRDVAITPNDNAVGTSGNANNRPVGTSGQLPKTGSELPLVGLIGLLSLAGALGTRFASTRA
jgi:LPXTG-motif cell wall-anchored protein